MGREEGSGWGTHVYLWQIHFDIWQNQYNIVKLNKIKFKKKKERNFLYPGLPGSSDSKYLPTMWEIWVQSLGQEDPLGKGMATHSSILAWRIPSTEEPGGL